MASKGLKAKLVKLAKPSGLWAVVTKHRSQVIELYRLRPGVEVVLDIGPDNSRCAFRPQGDAPAATILEGVHLFLNDVRAVANAS